ncbi:Blue light- and temperature-regulated antirepressor YcgF [Rubripirellula tenax]|uniref:Blue light-and temperature-regulated antirepressor YcgF n=1 Tax=Rubripirellula tenax TaxID=2528015 RepID=A0A5C6FJM9_9BACT|nr:BLUF domain-containing protein [Rubripirellula tenax]TWU60249.1 Blue light- and temperature-regulated antirepressor YcgF [Rubripirellula tenax]
MSPEKISSESTSQRGLVQLVYVSAANAAFSDDQLDELLAIARQNNTSLDVTGVLLFTEGTFFQVLEGHPDVVQKLYDKIALDSRHSNVLMLAKSEIDERNFGDWSMGFVRDQRVMNELTGFVDFFSGRSFMDLAGDSRRVEQTLDGFRRGRWRRQIAEAAS